jgi:hypothetical protein
MTRPAATPVPRLVRGSVIIHRRRCGGPSCHCSDGVSLHESTVLSYSEAGRTRFLMLPAHTVGAVRAATERYRAEKARLEERANQGLDALVATLVPPRRRS